MKWRFYMLHIVSQKYRKVIIGKEVVTYKEATRKGLLTFNTDK